MSVNRSSFCLDCAQIILHVALYLSAATHP